jgi:hypothetical protein
MALEELLLSESPGDPAQRMQLRARTDEFIEALERERWAALGGYFPSKDCAFPDRPDEARVAEQMLLLLGLPPDARVSSAVLLEARVSADRAKGLSVVSLELRGRRVPQEVSIVWMRNCGDWRIVAAALH